jgi:hypothetical protein
MTTPSVDPALTRLLAMIRLAAEVGRDIETAMTNMTDLMTRIAELQSGQTELLKDVRRLIEAGNTEAAIAQLDTVITANEQLDTEVESASPETTEPPASPGASEELNLSGT